MLLYIAFGIFTVFFNYEHMFSMQKDWSLPRNILTTFFAILICLVIWPVVLGVTLRNVLNK
jgi:hypothetical protein